MPLGVIYRSPDMLASEAKRSVCGLGILVAYAAGICWVPECNAQGRVAALRYAESLRLDGGSNGFVPIAQLAVGRDGTIGVWQSMDAKVRLFSPEGKELGSFGRSGEGPGEFRSLGAYGWVGDTLWILDARLHRTSFHTVRGALVRDVPWLPQLSLPSPSNEIFLGGFGGAAPAAVLPDGNFIPMAGVHLPERRGVSDLVGTDNESIVLVKANGVLSRVILTTAPLGRPKACFQEWQVGATSGSVGAPFCASSIKAFSPDGAAILVIEQGNPRTSKGQFSLLLISTRGDTILRRVVPFVPEQIARGAIEAEYAKATPRGMRLAQMPKAYLEARKRLPRLDYYPPVRRALLGRDDTIWLEMDGASPSHKWVVLNTRDGSVVGELLLPPNITLRAVSRTAVWATTLDRDDVPSVVRLSITSP